MTEKEKAIREIEGLYPPDSDYRTTRDTGRSLLGIAIYQEWRHLPEEIILKFRDLCVNEERK